MQTLTSVGEKDLQQDSCQATGSSVLHCVVCVYGVLCVCV